MQEKYDLTVELFNACRDGDIKTFQALVNDGASLNEHYLDANMSIMQVSLLTYNQMPKLSRQNKVAIFRLLLAHAPEQLFYQNSDGDTVAHLLATNGYNDLISELLPTQLELFMIPNAQIKYPIFCAVLNHQYETVKILLSTDYEFCNLVDARKRNILHYAVQTMDVNMLDTCLSFCPKLIDAPDFNNETPQQFAIKMDAPPGIIQLLESAAARQHCSSTTMR